jgi:hypothetical protein
MPKCACTFARVREDNLSWHEIGGLLDVGPLAAASNMSVGQ